MARWGLVDPCSLLAFGLCVFGLPLLGFVFVAGQLVTARPVRRNSIALAFPWMRCERTDLGHPHGVWNGELDGRRFVLTFHHPGRETIGVLRVLGEVGFSAHTAPPSEASAGEVGCGIRAATLERPTSEPRAAAELLIRLVRGAEAQRTAPPS